MDVSDESEVDCSDAFTLIASPEAPFSSEDYSLTVTSPAAGDMAKAGEEYTVEVSKRRSLAVVRAEDDVLSCDMDVRASDKLCTLLCKRFFSAEVKF